MNSYTRYWSSLSYIMPNLVGNLFVTALDFYFYVNTPAIYPGTCLQVTVQIPV